MRRVHVICEGPTEATFVKELLQQSFMGRGIVLLPSLIGKPGHKGGYVSFSRVLSDVRSRLRQERQSYCTTFIDYYGIDSKFPGRSQASSAATAEQRCIIMNTALADAIEQELPDDALRFIPHVQVHEFEGLLFSEPDTFAREICCPQLATGFEKIADSFPTPEDIDDTRETSPSHRIIDLYPNYEKVLDGSIVALGIGLQRIVEACPCFADWIERLEQLSPGAPD